MNRVARVCLLGFILFNTAPLTAAELDARLHWHQKALLSTPVPGVIVEIGADIGEKVSKNQVLLRLDDRLAQAQAIAFEAELKRAENNHDEAQRELDRTQELYDQTLLAEHDLQMAVIARDAALADFQQAKAALVQAMLQLEYSAIRAPFDGYVVQRRANTGQVVNPELQADALFEIAESGSMVARVQANLQQARSAGLGQSARVVVNGRNFDGKVVRSALEGTSDGARYEVDVVFDTQGQVFRAGQPARVIFP